MTPHASTEDALVEQPAIALCGELGWSTVSAIDETFGASGKLARETKSEVVLAAHLRIALQKLDQHSHPKPSNPLSTN